MAMSFGFCGVKVRLLSGNILKICNFLTDDCLRPREADVRACLKMEEIKKNKKVSLPAKVFLYIEVINEKTSAICNKSEIMV